MTIPRVTEILNSFTSYDQVPKDILNRAAARGTSVHAICAGIAKGAWIPDGMIDEELKGYVNSFKIWSDKQVKKYVLVEKRFTNEDYTGQIDFVVVGNDDELYLVDLKTSAAPQRTYPVQMAAYRHLLGINSVQVKGAMLVYLNKNGEFPEVNLITDTSKEMSVFWSALECWKYFKQRKKDARNKECVSESISDNGRIGLHSEGFQQSQRAI